MSTRKNLILTVRLLTALFLGLKLTGYITWSWWWVLSHLWIPLMISFATAIIFIVLLIIIKIFNKIR